jgi:predicted DNA-binding protein
MPKDGKRINVPVSDELHRRAKILAAQMGRPLAEIVRELLEEHLKEQEAHPPTDGKYPKTG